MGWSVEQRMGLTRHHPSLSHKGYTLVVPLGGDAVYLVDMDGRFAHRWRFDGFRPHKAELLDNGNLLVMGLESALLPAGPAPPVGSEPEPFRQRIRRLGANCSALREIDWHGHTVWEHRDGTMHHDFSRTSSGTVVLPVWVEMPDDLTKAVRGGTKLPREKVPPMLGDDLVEVDRDGEEVRRVATWKLYDPRRDPICPLEARIEWTHMNSVDVHEDGRIVVSCRNNSRVSVIDPDGAMSWNYGAPDTAHQHHATWLANGNIQIFDNGMHRVRALSTSRVIEVDPTTDDVVWSYEGQPAEQFFSGHISGATRLPNGNTLVCEGTAGRLIEVTRTGEVVWEWWCPVSTVRPDGRSVRWLFRAYRYGPDHPGLAERDLDPDRLADLNRLHGLA